MALVKLHDGTRRDIIRSACAGLSNEILKIEREVMKCFNTEDLYALAVPADVQARLKEIPEALLSMNSSFSVNMFGSSTLGFPGYTWSVALAPNRPWPRGLYNVNVTSDHASTLPGYGPAMELLQRRGKLLTERATLEASLKKLLDSCNTLKQVHAVWPTVLDHVDRQTREKFNEKVERKKAPKATEIDPSIKATLVKSTMLTAKQ